MVTAVTTRDSNQTQISTDNIPGKVAKFLRTKNAILFSQEENNTSFKKSAGNRTTISRITDQVTEIRLEER